MAVDIVEEGKIYKIGANSYIVKRVTDTQVVAYNPDSTAGDLIMAIEDFKKKARPVQK